MAETLEQKADNGLQTVIPAGLNYLGLDRIAKAYVKDNTNTKLLAQYAQAITPYPTEESIAKIAQEMKKLSPAIVKENMDQTIKEQAQNLTQIVSTQYANLANTLPKEFLAQMALAVSGKKDEAEAIIELIKKGELDTVRKAYAGARKNKAWQHFVANASDEFIKSFAPIYFNGEAENFLQNYAKVEKNSEGKDEAIIDTKKLTDYILAQQANAKDDKQKEALYLRTGKGIAQFYEEQMKMAEAAQKKAAEAEAKKAKK